MRDDGQQPQGIGLEQEKLELERYKIRLDYKKFVLGSVFVALAIAAIPPLFQLATAGLEYVKSNADRQTKQQAFRDDYIKEFVSNALNQDIELRIRFAQYFAQVATEPSRQDWLAYLKDLKDTRDAIRTQIDKMEAEWLLLSGAKDRNETEIARLERNLAWAYKEVGYVERNRSAAINPRAPESTSSPPGPIPPWLGTMRDITGTQWSSGPAPATILNWKRFISNKYSDMTNYLAPVERSYMNWSGLAVAYCMVVAGIRPPYDPQNELKSFLRDEAWLDFGTVVDTPQVGDVLVFNFGGGNYHVALLEGLAADGNYISRGGNQSHEVRVSTFPKSAIKALRRPLP
jgi:hypothetical protein